MLLGPVQRYALSFGAIEGYFLWLNLVDVSLLSLFSVREVPTWL
jgi:hypothetical protein